MGCRVRRGDLKTLEQFLDHLRKRDVVPARKLVCDRPPLAHILNRYEKYLRSERGLVTITILHYQSFVRRFLVECFREGPFLLREVKPSDISNFILRHGHTMAVKRAQLMTTAFRSFFRCLFQKGELQADLAASVPTVADWRLSTVPKYLALARHQEVLNLRPQDVCLKPLSYVRLMGKGKKERITPIWLETATVLEAFMRRRNAGSNELLFLNRYGAPLGAAGFRFCLTKYVHHATAKVPSIPEKHVTPHLFRYVLSFNYVLSLVLFFRFLIYFPSCSDQLG
jgi:site-specific recombinase XerD